MCLVCVGWVVWGRGVGAPYNREPWFVDGRARSDPGTCCRFSSGMHCGTTVPQFSARSRVAGRVQMSGGGDPVIRKTNIPKKVRASRIPAAWVPPFLFLL